MSALNSWKSILRIKACNHVESGTAEHGLSQPKKLRVYANWKHFCWRHFGLLCEGLPVESALCERDDYVRHVLRCTGGSVALTFFSFDVAS